MKFEGSSPFNPEQETAITGTSEKENPLPARKEGVLEQMQISSQKVLARLFKEKDSTREAVTKVLERFGDSLQVENVDFFTIITHLEHLSKLPEGLVERIKGKGIKVKMGYKDMPGLSDNKVFTSHAPRGWAGRTSWSGVPGCYDSEIRTVYAGKGWHGSESLVLHELGHGIGAAFGLNDSYILEEAHKRLFKKLTSYLQQGEAGGSAGKQELLAESFASFFQLSKKRFIRRYDQALYQFFENLVNERIEAIGNYTKL